MLKVNHAEFMKKIFKKGKFQQFMVSPYASDENHYQKVLLLSDQVTEPTNYFYRKSKMALILPDEGLDVKQTVSKHIREIEIHTVVCAPYFGLFDIFDSNKLLLEFESKPYKQKVMN